MSPGSGLTHERRSRGGISAVHYELSFPPSLEFQAYFEAGDLRDRSTKNVVLRTELWPPDECFHAPGENKIVPLQEMALPAPLSH